MTPDTSALLRREAEFSAFATGTLLEFWRQREEGEFPGVDGVPIRFVRFSAPQHTRLVVVFPGRIESYVKYGEVAYDLFQAGYDVLIMDHRGQGRSGRVLQDGHRGHVIRFADYVDDVEQFWLLFVQPDIAVQSDIDVQSDITVPADIAPTPPAAEAVDGHSVETVSAARYTHAFAIGHSMGGAILAHFLARRPHAFDAAALCAPMCGIRLPMPGWLASRIVNWAERYPGIRDYYALGTGQWRPLPYLVNVLTHSRERYRRSVRFYADDPGLRVGGPTYHWIREAMAAGQELMALAPQITTPLLLLQAREDIVVDNHSQNDFCQALAQAGHPCVGGEPQVIAGARHELLFEQDEIRVQVFTLILDHFAHHSSLGGHDRPTTRG